MPPRRDDFGFHLGKGGDRGVFHPDFLNLEFARTKTQQLVEILVVARVVGVGHGGEIRPGQYPAIMHRDRLFVPSRMIK